MKISIVRGKTTRASSELGFEIRQCLEVSSVISREAVGNSWDILYAILGHEHYHGIAKH